MMNWYLTKKQKVRERRVLIDFVDEKLMMKEKAQEAILSEIKNQLRTLKPSQPEEEIKKSCLKLVYLFST
jgi:hypothetical protein